MSGAKEWYRISYRKRIDMPLQFTFRDDLEAVVEWLKENGAGLKQVFIVREDGRRRGR